MPVPDCRLNESTAPVINVSLPFAQLGNKRLSLVLSVINVSLSLYASHAHLSNKRLATHVALSLGAPRGRGGGGEFNERSSEVCHLAVAWHRADQPQDSEGNPTPRELLRCGVDYTPTLRVSADLLDLGAAPSPPRRRFICVK